MALILIAHFVFHVGMNIGLLPITGLPLSFMSYGGSHTVSVLAGLGILSAMRRKNYGAVSADYDTV